MIEAPRRTTATALSARRRSRRLLVALWVAPVIVFGSLTAYSRLTSAPLADPDPAYQRPGFLDVIPAYAAAPLGMNLPAPHTRSVVFFTRPQFESDLVGALTDDATLQSAAHLVVVVCGPAVRAAAAVSASIAVVTEGAGCPAAALYRMRTPRDGGAPVGYAIVDSAGVVHYSTLDPDVVNLLGEVEVMTRGVT